MSKAFTREDAEVPETAARRRGVPVPSPNLVTEAGLARLRAELAATATDPDRQRVIADHLATAEVPAVDTGQVGFGVHVTVEDDEDAGAGARTTYHLVGAIEADVKQRAINWQSPLAAALRGARVGDVVTLPRGNRVRVVSIA